MTAERESQAGATVVDFPAPPKRPGYVAPPPPQCEECKAEHREPGLLCASCRAKAPRLPASFFVGSIAAAIKVADGMAEKRPTPLPTVILLDRLRRAYDACEPLINEFSLGRIELDGIEFWAYPNWSSEALGPFGSRTFAEDALVIAAAKHRKVEQIKEREVLLDWEDDRARGEQGKEG